jgi:WD40 repeat protein
VWDQLWNLARVFVGHTASITSIVRHPYPPLIVTSSLDGRLRVWNLGTMDAVLVVDTGTKRFLRFVLHLTCAFVFHLAQKKSVHNLTAFEICMFV